MVPGQERAHFAPLLAAADSRGSDAILRSQVLRDDSTQELPYPAFAWEWEATPFYKWASPQHINILEFVACFNWYRSHTNSKDFHSLRMWHVFDSRVVACIVTKGRTSSRALN
eukprot:5651854-Pyramimonas_sp.AAC.1